MKNLNAKQLLQRYQAQLDQYFSQHQDASPALSDLLHQQFSNAQLCHLLGVIIADPTTLADVSQRSYQHGNGFLKVVLLERGYKLRLHIWFAGQSCEENIHDHRWSFSSLILAGKLRSEIWQDAAQGQALQEFIYTAAQPGTAPFKVAKGTSTLHPVNVQCHQAGQSYVMPKGKLHRIVNPGNQLVASMMCSAPTEQGTTRLIPLNNGVDPNIQPPKITAAQLKISLSAFLHHLEQATGEQYAA